MSKVDTQLEVWFKLARLSRLSVISGSTTERQEGRASAVAAANIEGVRYCVYDILFWMRRRDNLGILMMAYKPYVTPCYGLL